MLTLHQQHDSGNCYKVRLILAHANIPYRTVEVNSLAGETRTAEYRAINPFAKVPAVVFDDGRKLAESNAILLYFACGGRFLPNDDWTRALMHQWLFFEQYSHEPAIAVRRSLLVYPERRATATAAQLDDLLARGNAALAVMEGHLAANDWLAGDAASVADLSLYAYTHIANEGGFDLDAYPAVGRWLARVAELPGHVAMR